MRQGRGEEWRGRGEGDEKRGNKALLTLGPGLCVCGFQSQLLALVLQWCALRRSSQAPAGGRGKGHA